MFIDSVINLVTPLAPFAIGAGFGMLGLALLRKSRRLGNYDRARLGDGILIATAIEEVDNDPPKAAYLNVTVLMELERLTDSYLKASRVRTILGAIYLVAGFASIAITGTNASIPGFADTVKFSFAVNIVGEIASGFLLFGGFEATSVGNLQTAALIRLELGQFVAQSAEYHGQASEVRWYLLTESIEKLLIGSIVPMLNTKKEDSKKESSDESDSAQESD